MKQNYKATMFSCYIGYITQAAINNFVPLLFLYFQSTYDLTFPMITSLVTFNFLTQLAADFLAANFLEKIGYRPAIVTAHLLAAAGLIGLAVFPMFMEPYAGLLLAVLVYSFGGGLLEVMISPIVEACPNDNKEAAMSFLHSFYGWGSLLVIACTTLLFRLIGIENWTWVAFMWALLPICNAISFCRVPIAKVVEDGQGLTLGQLFRQKIFWAFALVMICSGASELAMSQWASAFAESGLHVSKTVGDLAGPCFFAACMGISRVMHAKLSGRIRLETYMMVCGILCSLSYLLAILPLPPMVNLLGCGFCGLSVGVMWPGTCSLASQHCPRGGIAMFGMLALFGDVGCSTGPTVVGLVSNLFRENLKVGLGAAMIFPLLIVLSVYLITKKDPVKK